MRTRLARSVWSIGTAFVLAFVASSAWDEWRLQQEVEASSKRELANLARAVAAQANRGIQAVDLLLTDTALWYRTRAGDLPRSEIEAELASRAIVLPQVSVLTIVDAQGRQAYRSRATGRPLADVSDRPYFLVQRDHPATGLYINAPLVTRSEQRESLVLSRRLEGVDGSFAGVVTVSLPLDLLWRAYDAIDIGSRGSLLMLMADGTTVVRVAPTPEPAASVRRPDWAALKDGTVDVRTSPADGREKLVAVVGVSHWPLMIAISRDREDLLRPVRAEFHSLALRLLALVVFAGLTMVWLGGQLRRLKAGEEALRESEERYALAMDAANEGHAEWNLADDRRFASPKWRAQHGLSPSADPGPITSLPETLAVHPDDAAAMHRALDDHLAGRKAAVELEYRIRRDDGPGSGPGAWRWVAMRGRCVSDATGTPRRFSCATVDISGRKAAEEARARLEAQLSQARHLEALGTLAGGIAHDFNNILGAILGHGELAQRDARDGTAQRRHLDLVMQAGQRAKQLVRRVLDFSGAGIRERGLVPVQAAVDEALLLLASTIPPSVHLVSGRMEGDGAAIRGGATQIHQLVSNLCTNAIGAMPGGGTLAVEVTRLQLEAARTLSHGSIGPGPVVRIAVRDTGTGIAPEVYARMFDPFFSTKSVGEGTGLGLSVVHSIVTELEGALDVQTAPGQGSTFTAWLPVAAEAAPAPEQRSAVLPRGHGQVVMVVDDEPALVEFAEDLLAVLGYEPVGFTSGSAALQALRADPARFDALLTDETMPDLTGVELVEEALRLRPGLRAMVMSGYCGEALKASVARSGALELLHKPLAAADIAASLERLFAVAAAPG